MVLQIQRRLACSVVTRCTAMGSNLSAGTSKLIITFFLFVCFFSAAIIDVSSGVAQSPPLQQDFTRVTWDLCFALLQSYKRSSGRLGPLASKGVDRIFVLGSDLSYPHLTSPFFLSSHPLTFFLLPSLSSPKSATGLGERWERCKLPSGVWGGARPPKYFDPFTALKTHVDDNIFHSFICNAMQMNVFCSFESVQLKRFSQHFGGGGFNP